MARKRHDIEIELLYHVVLIFAGITMLAPFIWMIFSSLKTLEEVFKFPPRLIPKEPQWSNYVRIWSYAPFGQYFLNSFKIAVLSTIGQIFSCSLAAYAFARLKFPGRDIIFLVLLMTLMLPYQLTMIPVFYIMYKLGWVDTHIPLILPFFLGGAWSTFLTRQFFLTIPRDLDDAAKIDGCSPLGIYLRIYLPLSKPIIATIAVFTFLGRWNDLYGPLIYLHTPSKLTVTVGLSNLRGQYWTDIPLLMAGSLVSILPTIILFLAMQRYYIQGVVLSGMKG
jgi:multiple sugar transport system permease protein